MIRPRTAIGSQAYKHYRAADTRPRTHLALGDQGLSIGFGLEGIGPIPGEI